MEPITLLLVAGLATGLSQVKPPSIDLNEYQQVVTVTAYTTQAISNCKDRSVQSNEIEASVLTLLEYESHIPNMEHNLVATNEMKRLIGDFNSHSFYTVKYCQHKLSELQVVSRTLARAMGGLNKFNICDMDVTTRKQMYDVSYKQGLITWTEFDELVQDLIHLKEVDKSSCSIENATKMDQALEIIEKAGSIVGSL